MSSAPLDELPNPDELIVGLNPEQRKAVTAPPGPVLIYAGAGSGKTRVLTHRIAWLIAAGHAAPYQICAVTFTNKAAKEMRERVEALLGTATSGMWLGTFHSFGARFLRDYEHHNLVGRRRSFTIYDGDAQSKLIERIASSLDIRLKDLGFTPGMVRERISRHKDSLRTPVEAHLDALDNTDTVVAKIYQVYEQELLAANAVDFGDLIKLPAEILLNHPDVLESYQRRYQWILVDEYQDTNHAQYTLIRTLAARSKNLTVVGDDSQCLVEGTQITLPDLTTKPIEKIRPGDFVLSGYGGCDFRSALVTSVAKRKATTGIRITTTSGKTLKSTLEHTHFASTPTEVHSSSPANRVGINVVLCAKPGPLKPVHQISIHGISTEERNLLDTSKLNTQLAIFESASSGQVEIFREDFPELLEIAERIRSLIDRKLVYTTRIGKTKGEPGFEGLPNLKFVLASSLRSGMNVLNQDGGFETVETVDRIPLDKPVYDLDIANTHNFIANGIFTHNSIYAFRGADIQNILSFRQDYPEATVITLEQNYRSHQAILDASTAVISNNTSYIEKQLWSSRKTGESVRLFRTYDANGEAQVVAQEIERLLDTTNPVTGQALSYSQMAVLYRVHALSRAVEQALARRRIPYRIVGGLRFFDRAEIKDVLAYLRVLNNPSDTDAFVRAVAAPSRGIGVKSVEALIFTSKATSTPLLDVAQNPFMVAGITKTKLAGITAFGNLMAELQELATHLPLSQLLNEIMHRTQYRTYVNTKLKEPEPRQENLDELLNLATEWDSLEPQEAIEALLESSALTSSAEVNDAEAEMGAVTLTTVHAVKGLEFDVTFVIGLEEGVFPHSRSLGDDFEIEEERRLAYVALTRARDRLYLSSVSRRSMYGASAAYGSTVSRFIGEIPKELLQPHPVPNHLASYDQAPPPNYQPPSWATRTADYDLDPP